MQTSIRSKPSRFIVVLAASLVAMALGTTAAAAEPESFAVVALIGDEISIVNYQPVTGSSLDQNSRQQVPMTDAHFDQLATRVTLGTIHRALPDATLQGLAVADRGSFGDTERLLAVDGSLAALVAAVRPRLQRPETHYLVVLSKFRGDARLRASNGTLGSGKIVGLGFYVDAYKRMTSSATGERGRGFVAPFAYVTASLVDLHTGQVVRSESAEETSARANVGPDADLDPWDALTAEQKIRLLDNLLGRALQRVVPRVVAPA